MQAREGRHHRVHGGVPRKGGWRLATAAGLGLLLLSSGAAQAQVIERLHYSGAFSGEEQSCGYDLHFEGTYSGLFMWKMRGNEPTPYVFNNYESHEVLTLEDGRGFVIETNGNYKDLRITHVRGTIYRFIWIDSGQVFTIQTLDGRVVERNRGLLKATYLVDTKGDSDPGNDVFIEGSDRLLKDAGVHPELYTTDEEFCAFIDEAIRG